MTKAHGGLRGVGAACAAAVACTVLGPTASPAQASVELRQVASFNQPVHVAQAPGQPRTLYVVEQPGRVMVVRRGRKLARPFLDIRDRVLAGPVETDLEAGLLSIAFDPGYQRNGRFYVFYVNTSGDNRVVAYERRGPKGLRAREASARTVLKIAHPFSDTHNGGQLQFAPDGMLWISSGDGDCCHDYWDQARSLGTLLGKLLRIDPRRRGGYRVPPDNPLVDSPGRDEIYAWGLRNPWRFSFDRDTAALLIGDVGDVYSGIDRVAAEEINYLPRNDSPAGANFGWPQYEGSAVNDPSRPGPGKPLPPIHEYGHASGACAVTGGYVVRDQKLPSLYGRYVFADFCRGRIESLVPHAGQGPLANGPYATGVRDEGLQVGYPSSFGEGLGGEIYVVSRLGPVYLLTETPPTGRRYP